MNLAFVDALNTLTANLDKLPASDQKFAKSLVAAEKKYGALSDKQVYWVGRLAQRATGTEPKPVAVDVGEMTGVMTLFEEARKHLKWPAIVLAFHDQDGYLQEIRLTVAGMKAKVPGSVNVVNTATKLWYGRILKDGKFERTLKCETPVAVVELLKSFAAEPAATAAAYGKLTGACCFCKHGLDDPRSTEVGYGPVCAKHFGLPWGGK